MMKFNSERMELVEKVYTDTLQRITEDTMDVYWKLSKWYDQMSNGNFQNFKRFMAVCKTV